MTFRIGDFAQSQKTIASLLTVKNRMTDTQATIDSGMKSSTLAGYGAQAASVVALRNQGASTSAYLDQTKLVGARLDTMDTSLQSLSDVADRLQTLVTSRMNGTTAASSSFDAEISSMMDTVQSALNATYNGQYLFGGSQTDAKPVDLAGFTSAGDADGSYYSGDHILASVQANATTTVGYGIAADNPAFTQLVSALGAAKAANLSGNADDLTAALGKATTAVSNMADLRSVNAVKMATISDISDALNMNQLYLKNASSDVEQTDLAAAVSQVSADSVTLQAAYATMTKIAALSLTDYLR